MQSTRNGCMRLAGGSTLAVATLVLPIAAWAQVAYTTQAVNMRAGPDRAYPQVAWLPSGVAVDVAGCVDGYRWCDVVAGPNRGWVYTRPPGYGPPPSGRPPGGGQPPHAGQTPGTAPPSSGRPPGGRPPGSRPQPPLSTNSSQQ